MLIKINLYWLKTSKTSDFVIIITVYPFQQFFTKIFEFYFSTYFEYKSLFQKYTHFSPEKVLLGLAKF